jgi:L-amino acid N-acyltransferase YncA
MHICDAVDADFEQITAIYNEVLDQLTPRMREQVFKI